MSTTNLQNKQVQAHLFLADMYQDAYFPDNLVDKGKALLLQLCAKIEVEKPATLEAFYALTQATTEQFNQLEVEFGAQESELETVARENIALDMMMISLFYGYEADAEEMIANRNW
ncbi:MAG: DUF5713 family protein [Aureispira sp.]